MDARYRIVRARPRDIVALPAIELAAVRLLSEQLPAAALTETRDEDDLRRAQDAGHLWVALADDTPAGFALITMINDTWSHLEEMDVHPDHGRRGVGAALLEEICGWAARSHHARLSLTTFREVAWNMPFYAKHGFVEVPRNLMPPALAANRCRRSETRTGSA